MEPRSVTARWKKGESEVIHGWHHRFYTDTNNDPYVIMEDRAGLVRCLCLDYWEYRFDRTPLTTPAQQCQGGKGGQG